MSQSTVTVRNLSTAYYGFERPVKDGKSKMVMLNPFFSGKSGGYEELKRNDSVSEITMPKSEWDALCKSNPKLKKDSVADFSKGQEPILRVT